MRGSQFIFLIVCLLSLGFPMGVYAQRPVVVSGEEKIPVVRQDSFTNYQNQIQEKLQALRKEIKNGKDALEISERYSNKADGLVSLFLGLFGLILTLASVFLGFFLKSLFDRKTERMERDLQNQLQESIETFRRITSTEKESIFIKKNARILAVSGEDASPDLLAIQLALSNFNTEKLSISSLPDLLNSRIFREFMESDAPLRVMLVGDELFSETYNGQAGSDNLAELDMAAKRVFSLIETQEIGLVNFGRMKMPKSIHYQAFSNSPYSAYTNLNSLLKYMLATKEIEI